MRTIIRSNSLMVSLRGCTGVPLNDPPSVYMDPPSVMPAQAGMTVVLYASAAILAGPAAAGAELRIR